MLHYALIVGQPDAVRREASRLRSAVEATAFFEGEWGEVLAPSSCWAVGAVSAPDPTCTERVRTEGDVAVLFNGPALHLQGRQDHLTDDVFAAFRAEGEAGLASVLGGTYNAVGVSPDKGVRALGDASGLFPLYWGRGDDFAVVSNRSTTISELLGRGWDPTALAWHLARPNICGERMPALGARYLPPGHVLRADFGSDAIRVERGPTWIWPEPSSEPPRTDLTDDEWDAVTAELVGNFRSLASIGGGLKLFLTGGKDSRLCLALAKAAGLRETLGTVTWGDEDSPEVEVAREVARVAGFEHRAVSQGQALPQPGHGQPGGGASGTGLLPKAAISRLSQGLRHHVHRYEAIVNPWDGANRAQRGTQLQLKGFGGELYRGPGGTSRRLASLPPEQRHPDRLVALLANQHNHPFDCLGLLRDEIRDELYDWLRDWTKRALSEVRADVIGEKFFLEYRLGHWNGPLGQFRAGSINVNPLIGPTSARKVMELDMTSRDHECVHFEVMRRTAPELVDLPFLGQTWAPELAERSGLDLPTEPYPTRQSAAGTRWKKPKKWLFLEQQRPMIAALFEHAAGAGLAAICDVDRAAELTRSGTGFDKNFEAKTVYGALAITIALLGEELPDLDRPLDVPGASTS